jgi:hypothetical protein
MTKTESERSTDYTARMKKLGYYKIQLWIPNNREAKKKIIGFAKDMRDLKEARAPKRGRPAKVKKTAKPS